MNAVQASKRQAKKKRKRKGWKVKIVTKSRPRGRYSPRRKSLIYPRVIDRWLRRGGNHVE